MWLFTTDGFLSIVHKGCRPGQLMVRARVRADLKRAFPKAKITASKPPADYRYRAVVSRKALAAYLGRMAERLAYANFKDTVRDDARHAAYMRVWQAMLSLQEHSGARPRTILPAPRSRLGAVDTSIQIDDGRPYGQSRFDDMFEDFR